MSRSSGKLRHPDMIDIVITGSTGVIGRHAIRDLLAERPHVTGLTRSADGSERRASLTMHAVEADMLDDALLRRAFERSVRPTNYRPAA
jgi:UDP-glucose 4-epimerase